MTMFQVIRFHKKQTSIKDSLSVFHHPNFGKILATFLVKQLLLFLWSLIPVIGFSIMGVGALMAVGGSFYNDSEVLALAGVLMMIGLFIMIAGIALYIPQELAYSQTEFILFEQLKTGSYNGPMAVIKESRRIMKGYKGQRFVLALSFIGWFILERLTFGILGIYVLPYYYAAQMHFYDAVLADRKMKEEMMMGLFTNN